MEVRDIKADYKAAYIAEYEAHKRAGNEATAAGIADLLREHYGHDVAPKPRKQTTKKQAAPERVDVKRPAEDAAAPKPRHTRGDSDA